MTRKRNGPAVAIGVAGALLTVGPASSAPAPSLGSAQDNVAYAVATLCAPYVLDHVQEADLPIGRGLVQRDGYDGAARRDPTAVRVGLAGFVHVKFSERADGGRACDVQAKGADPQMLRQVVLQAIGERPEHFAPTRSKYLPRRFETEDMMCAAPDGPHPEAFMLLSSPAPAERERVALLFTLASEGPRMASCDQPGVALNFRTLAPAQ